MSHLENNGMGKQLFIYVLLSVTGACIGYGISQETMRNELTRVADQASETSRQLTSEIQDRKESDAAMKQQLADAMNQAQSQIAQLAGMQRTTLEQNNQVISLIKVQNQILNKP
jgi:negative regulator of sigma E activity